MSGIVSDEKLKKLPKCVEHKTCRICTTKFDPAANGPRACRYHPESFAGETAQRWLPPGETKGGGIVHYFYTCCGGGQDSEPCCYTAHRSFDEPEDIHQRLPGMGVGS